MSRQRIAYVDDSREMTLLVRTTLEAEGYEVLVAHDGEQGLELILVEKPDLVILDVMMPQLNGWEITKYLRSKPEWADTPILMLTGIGATLNAMTAPLYGSDDFLDKPFDLETLIEKVEALLAKKRESPAPE